MVMTPFVRFVVPSLLLFLFCKEGTEKTLNKYKNKKVKPGIFAAAGVRARPNCKWSTAKTAGKTVFPGVFPRFGVGDFFFGGLGGVQSPSRAPRLGTSGDFFGSFLVGQKGTFRSLPGARTFRVNRPQTWGRLCTSASSSSRR